MPSSNEEGHLVRSAGELGNMGGWSDVTGAIFTARSDYVPEKKFETPIQRTFALLLQFTHRPASLPRVAVRYRAGRPMAFGRDRSTVALSKAAQSVLRTGPAESEEQRVVPGRVFCDLHPTKTALRKNVRPWAFPVLARRLRGRLFFVMTRSVDPRPV